MATVSLYATPSANSCSFTWSNLDASASLIVSGVLYVLNTATQQLSNYPLTKTQLVGDCNDPCGPAPVVVSNLMNGVTYEAYLSVLLVDGSFIRTSNNPSFICDAIPSAPVLLSATYTIGMPDNFIAIQATLGDQVSDVTSLNAVVLSGPEDYYTVFNLSSLTPVDGVYSFSLTTPFMFRDGSRNSIALVAQNNAGVSAPSNVITVFASTTPAPPVVTGALSGFDRFIPFSFTQQDPTVGTITGFDISFVDVSNNNAAKLLTIPDASLNFMTRIGNTYSLNIGASPFTTPTATVSDGLYYKNFQVRTYVSGTPQSYGQISVLKSVPATAPVLLQGASGSTITVTALGGGIYQAAVAYPNALDNGSNLIYLSPPYYNLVLTNVTTGLQLAQAQTTDTSFTFSDLVLGSTDVLSCSVVANIALTNTQKSYWSAPTPVPSVLSSNTILISGQVPYAPGQVTGVNVIPFNNASDTSANFFLSWLAPASSGSSPIDNYKIKVSTTTDFSGAQEINSLTVENCTFTGLVLNTNYWFQIAAGNEDNLYSTPVLVGPFSSEINFQPPSVSANIVNVIGPSMQIEVSADASAAYVPSGLVATFLVFNKVDPVGNVTNIANIPWSTALAAGTNNVLTSIPISPAGSEWVFEAYIVGSGLTGPSGTDSINTYGTPRLVNVTSVYSAVSNQTTVTAKLIPNGAQGSNPDLVAAGTFGFGYLGPLDVNTSGTTRSGDMLTTPNSNRLGISSVDSEGNYLVTGLFDYRPQVPVSLVLLITLEDGTAFYQQNM